MQKTILILIFLLLIAALSWSVYRDIQIEKQYPGDLRNRVVGARLQKDGHLPYFYKWKTIDGLRYYDPQNFDDHKISNITATPFLHQLLYPIADLPQRTISKIWLFAEYLLLLIMAFIGLSLAKNKTQQWAVAITTVLFLFTYAWIGHIAAGQIYLAIPFLMMLFYCFISNRSKVIYAAFAGLIAASLILIRPTALLFFLPFLLIIRFYSFKYKMVFIVSTILVFVLALGGRRERMYWMQYKSAIKEQVRSHQNLNPALQQNEPDPRFIKWECWDTKQISIDASRFKFHYNREQGNVFIFINHFFKRRIPVWLLSALSIFVMTCISLLFYKRNRSIAALNLYQLTLFAFCLYMVTDFFSPIYRPQYNATQWFFPLLLIASHYQSDHKKIYAGILAGLVLNSINLPFMLLEQSLGEYLVFLSILILLFTYKPITQD